MLEERWDVESGFQFEAAGSERDRNVAEVGIYVRGKKGECK
jgi:hypothetical protein